MSTEERVRRRARVLAGFMTEIEARGFATSFVLTPDAFGAAWRACAEARSKLPAVAYQPPRIEDLSAAAKAHAAQIQALPIFPRIYPSADFKLVELGRLIAFQHWMDTDVSDGVHGAGSCVSVEESAVPIDG